MALILKVTSATLRAIFPRAPQKYIDGLWSGWSAMDRAGITATRQRLAYCLANCEHEAGGFTIPGLTENINYTAQRMHEVWPNRFASAAAVERKFGTSPGWQRKAFDDIYGGRMGNRPGSSDGSRYIGRGAPQITGRDGYAEIERRTGIPLVANPELAADPRYQAQIIAAFWSWKNLNQLADAGQWNELVRRWNGGTNGMADRVSKLAGNDPIIDRLNIADMMIPVAEKLPTKIKVTPQEGTAGGIIAGGAAAAAEAARQGAEPTTVIGILVAAVIVAAAAYFIVRKLRAS